MNRLGLNGLDAMECGRIDQQSRPFTPKSDACALRHLVGMRHIERPQHCSLSRRPGNR